MALWKDKQILKIFGLIYYRKNNSNKLNMKKETLQLLPKKYKRSWDYYEQLYINKLDNLKERDAFLVIYNLSTLNHKKREHLNGQITNKILNQ